MLLISIVRKHRYKCKKFRGYYYLFPVLFHTDSPSVILDLKDINVATKMSLIEKGRVVHEGCSGSVYTN